MSVPERDVLEVIAERLAGVLRRQDEIEARFVRIEAALGLDAARAPSPITEPETGQAPAAPPMMTAEPASAMPIAAAPEPPWFRPAAPMIAASAPPVTDEYVPPPRHIVEYVPPPLAMPAPSSPLAAGRATEAAAEAPTFEAQVGLKWLNRIGVITLVLGVAFAFKTAVDNNWIGPGARIALGVATALVTLAIGDFQWRRAHAVFAQGLTALGMALLYLSFWASFALYELWPQPVAFGLMVATTIASGLLAMRYASQAIAVLALLAGYVTPIALSTGGRHSVIFLSYVTLLNLATIVLARRRVWPALELLAAAATAVLFGGWLASADADVVERPIATVFAAVFYLQYALARSRIPWVFGQLAAPILMTVLWEAPEVRLPLVLGFALAGLIVAERRQIPVAPLWTALWFWAPALLYLAVAPASIGPELVGSSIAFAGFVAWVLWAHVKHRRPLADFDLALLLANPAAYFAAATVLLAPAHHAALGGFAIALTAVYLALGKLVWRAGDPAQRRRPAQLSVGVALVFFTVAAPLELDGYALVIVWALEGAGLVWLSARIANPRLAIAACGVLVLALGALPFGVQLPTLLEPAPVFVNLRFATFAVLVASLFVAARLLAEPISKLVAFVVAHALVLLAIGLELDGFWRVIAWALLGTGLVGWSARRTDDKLGIAGSAALGLAIAALAVAALRPELVDALTVVANLRFASFVVVIAGVFLAAHLLGSVPRRLVAHVLGHVLVLLAIGLELATAIVATVDEPSRFSAITVAISVLMAIYAVLLVGLGVARRRARDRTMGLVLMAVVILKLYGSDVWSLGRGFQVAAFLALGVLLLAVSYVYSRYRPVIGRLWKDEPQRAGSA